MKWSFYSNVFPLNWKENMASNDITSWDKEIRLSSYGRMYCDNNNNHNSNKDN